MPNPYCHDDHFEAELYAEIRKNLPPAPARILEIGCTEAAFASVVANEGYDVCGVDARPWGPEANLSQKPNFNFICADFVSLPISVLGGAHSFDVVAEMSAVEHFGCGFYGDPRNPYGDYIAWMKMAELTRGYVFATCIAHDGEFFEHNHHTRVYNYEEIMRFWSFIGKAEVIKESTSAWNNGPFPWKGVIREVLIKCIPIRRQA